MKQLRAFLLGVALVASSAALAQVYNYFAPGGALSGTGTSQNVNLSAGSPFIAGNLPLANLATQAANTINCNAATSSASPTACQPIQATLLEQASLIVRVATTANITLSGAQTIDGIAVGNGQTVLVQSQTTGSQNGIYVSASGAWTRSPAFPAGFVLPQNCDIGVLVSSGNTFGGAVLRLGTSAGAITIGTTALVFAQVLPVLSNFTAGTPGAVFITSTTTTVPSLIGGNNVGDAVGFVDASGSIGDPGNAAAVTGPPVVSDVKGHPLLVGTPAVTGAGCSLNAGSFDNAGSITATGIDTCTVTFASTGFTNAPHCTATGFTAAVAPTISLAPTTAHVIFVTAAAGTFNYLCL